MYELISVIILLLNVVYLLYYEYEKGYSEGLAHGIEQGRKMEKAEM